MKNSVLIVIVVILVLTVGTLSLVKTSNSTSVSSTPTPGVSPVATTKADPAFSPLTAAEGAQTVTKASELQDPSDSVTASKVVLKTSMGNIALNLYQADAPKTVRNFVTLGAHGYYNDIIFHRVIKGFMIQAGDPNGTGTGGSSIYGSTFPDEINSHKIVKGSLAMANRGANTNGSQFFIVTDSAQTSLDGGYTNFGEVADDASQQVVQAIGAVSTNSSDKPLTDVKITGFDIVSQ